MAVLTPLQIDEFLRSDTRWRLEDGKLVRDYDHPDFVSALAFVNRVGDLAEATNHHPDIDIRYNKVRLALISHDKGGITDRDTRMASRISGLEP